jgi:oligopeptidase B
MENIRVQEYPPMLLQAGLFDYRVAYWEVAKFAQRLRAANIKNILRKNNIIFKCEMDEGHTGAMDRFKQLREQAFEYGFVLDCFGICI